MENSLLFNQKMALDRAIGLSNVLSGGGIVLADECLAFKKKVLLT